MKKKIKDLTLEELEKFCLKHPFCKSCPLTFGFGFACFFAYKKIAQKYKKFDKEKEVEIDE